MKNAGTKTSDGSYTIKSKDDLLIALEQSLGVVTTACRAVNISRDTHYRWLKEDPNYKTRVEEIDHAAKDFGESLLLEIMAEKDTSAIIFFNKTRNKDRGYSERIEYKDVDAFEDKFSEKTPEEIAEELLEISKKMSDAIR